MSETQQTTGDRIMRLIETRFPDKAAQIIAAEIDALTRERDEARVQIAALEASNTEQAQMLADGFAGAKEQSARLVEARAEIERLRPAAAAWEAQQAAYQGLGSSLEYAYSVACVERATLLRAAKGEVKA